MPERQTDPARLEGLALRRWYARSPDQIEDERRDVQAQRYQAFFGAASSRSSEGSEDAGNSASPRPTPDDEALWIADGRGGYRKVRTARGDASSMLEPDQLANLPGYLPANPAAAEPGEFQDVENPHNRKLIGEWERANNRSWPRTADGRAFDVAHTRAIADGGANTLDNIRPINPPEHKESHRQDASRWGKRASIARAFGGRVEPPLHAPWRLPKMRLNGFGLLGPISNLTGILSGRIRRDSFSHFANDMMGFTSPDDFDRMAQDNCRAMGITTPGAECV